MQSESGGLKQRLKEGLEKGRAEGRTEEKRATVRNLFKLGIPIETISKAVEINIKLVQEWVTGNENGDVSPAR